MNRAGSFVSNLSGDLAYRSYCPANLPPTPGIQVDTHMTSELLNASRKLAELDSLSRYVPDTALFLSMYVRKEALISSQIEGTQCTLEDILAPDAEMNADPGCLGSAQLCQGREFCHRGTGKAAAVQQAAPQHARRAAQQRQRRGQESR